MMPTLKPSKSNLSIRRQRLTAARRALEKALANTAKQSEATVEEVAIAAAWAAVALVTDLVPGISGIDKSLSLKETSDKARTASRLAQAIAAAKLDKSADGRKKADDVTKINPDLKKRTAILFKLSQSKKDLQNASRQLKTKGGADPMATAMADIAAQAAKLADLGAKASGYMGAAASKMKDAALGKLLAAQIKQLAAIDVMIGKILSKMKAV